MRLLLIAPLATVFATGGSVPSASKSQNIVEIIGVDYAFRAPATLPAGRTTFRFRNTSKHKHELNVFLLKPGATIEQVIKAGKEGKPQMPFIDGGVGVLFALEGASSRSGLTTDLLPGRTYGIQCIFRDSTGKPRHYELGMYSVIRVTGNAPAAALMRADSVIAVDYAFPKYPREISPGVHTLVFRNSGKHRHEMNIALLKKGVTLDSVIAMDKKDADVEPLFERNGGHGLLHAMSDKSALGGLVIDFLPGREYLMDCSFQDDDKAPPHYKLGMYGSIRVRGAIQ